MTTLACNAKGVGKRFVIFGRPRQRLLSWLSGGRAGHGRDHWAVRNVSFELLPGRALGVIGGNGSGKTTLLRLVAGALAPSEGAIKTAGRVLLVSGFGGGFRSALTGRENVIVQSGLLRLPRAYVEENLARIREFADLGDFFDLPLSMYSGGMRTRLAFSMLAFYTPELLLLDEALTAGDAAFAAKCEARVEELLALGVAIVIATHNVAAVTKYCSEALLLHRGVVRAQGRSEEVVPLYSKGTKSPLLEA